MRRLNILLVEDDDDHAELLENALDRQKQIRVALTRSQYLADARQRLADDSYDAVLLDLSLSDSDPQETVPILCSQFPLATVIVLTSLKDVEIGRISIAQGAQDFVSKSDLRPDALAKSIIYSIERKRIHAELENKNEQLKRFAHLVAHEVKKPLQAVMTTFYHIDEKESEKLEEISRKLLGIGKGALDDMVSVTNDLLKFAELEATSSEHEEVSIEELVDDAVGMITLQEGCPPDTVSRGALPPVIGAPIQLRHVFQNLIGNAIQYRREEEAPSIKIVADQDPHDATKIRFSVSDNGIGISSEDRETVFELFRRLNPDGDVQGTGIGLGFCKQVIERHNGQIWVEKHDGPGSIFRFTLPKAY